MSEVSTNPFPGLRPFKFHEHELFFGREEQYEQMVSKLSNARFLAVVGTSGSGKSSLVRAGLLPALYGGLMMSAGSNWRMAVFRPKDDPIRELALALNHHRVFGSKLSNNGSSLLNVGDILDWTAFCSRLRDEAARSLPSPSRRILELLPSDVVQTIREANGNGFDPSHKSNLLSEFNEVLKRRDFYEPKDFEKVAIKGEAELLLGRGRDNLSDSEVQNFNRLVLEACYSIEIAKKTEIQTKITEVTLRRGDLGLVEAVRQIKTSAAENLLIVVDQFEELFRYARISENGPHGNQAAAFVKLLLEARNQTEIPIYVVLTMRSDYLGDCAKFWDLPEAINDGEYLIPRLTREQRREAIRGPIKLRRADITPQLVNQLLNDMGDNPDELPILQHALMRTWDYWSANHKGDQPIDINHYNMVGRMSQALSLHADEAYESLPEESRALTEKIFRCLTEKTSGARETRRPASLREIRDVTGAKAKEVAAIVNVFRRPDRSFLMPSARKPLKRGTSIDISHESLIRNWTKLREWVDKEARSANIYRRLVETARLHKQNLAGVLSGLEVEYALKWREDNKPNSVWASRYHPDLDILRQDYAELISENDRKKLDNRIFDETIAFLEQSKTDHLRQLRAQEKLRRKEIRQTQMRWFTSAVSAALIIAVVALVVAVLQWMSAVEQSNRVIKANDRNARLAYGAEMNLAQREFEEGNFAEVNRLIEDPNDILAQSLSLRGFEWYHLWSSSHNEIKTLSKHKSRLLAVSLPQNTNLIATATDVIATGTDDGRIEFADLSRQKILGSLGGGSKNLSTTVFSPDGKRVAIGSQDGSLKVLEMSGDFGSTIGQHDLVKQQTTNYTPIVSLAFSPDSRLLAAGTQDRSVTIWELSTGKQLTQFKESKDGVALSIAFSPDSNNVAIGRDGIVRLFNVNTGSLISTALLFQPANIKALAFSADGNTLAMGSSDSIVTLWDVTEKKLLTPLVGHSMEVLTIAFSKEGILATGSGDGSIRLWDLGRLADPTYRRALINANASLKQITHPVYDKSIELLRGTLNGHAGPVTSVAFLPNGKSLVSGGKDGSVKLWSTTKNSSANSTVELGWPSTQGISALAFSGNGQMLATSSYGGNVEIWNTSAKPSNTRNGEMLPPENFTPVNSIAFSPDSRLVATGGMDTHVRLWDPATRLKLEELKGHTDSVLSVSFSPDGQSLATGGADRKVILWDVSTKRALKTLPQLSVVLSIAFSPDGSDLAVAMANNSVAIWDLKEVKETATLRRHSEAVSSVVFSPDGKTLATGSWDTTAKLWDTRTWQQVATLQGHSKAVLSVAFSPRGERLATASPDGGVKLWDTSYELGDSNTRHALVTLKKQEGATGQEGISLVAAISVAFKPGDGDTLAIGNGDGTVLLRYANKEVFEQQSRPGTR
jgi:WD40 repeat protein